MTRVGFLWLLGSVTVLFGIAVLAMVVARVRARRGGRVAPRSLARAAPSSHPGGTAGDGVAAAMSAEEAGALSEPAAICPTCGARYGRDRRLCARDSSRLAPLH